MDPRVKTLMRKKGISQKQMAEKLGITKKELRRKIRGDLPVYYSEAVEIGRTLGISDLLGIKWL